MNWSELDRIKAGGVATGGLEPHRAGVFSFVRVSSAVKCSVDDLCNLP